jgi:plastocyanin
VNSGTVRASFARFSSWPLVGRGGDDEDAGAPPQEGGARVAPVELWEFAIEPARLELKRGATLDDRDSGAVPHNLTIERGPDATQPSERLAGTSIFGGGEAERQRVDLAPGRYTLVCTVGDHSEQGMVGSLTVR